MQLFEKLEKELASLRNSEDTVAHAKRLLETYSGQPPCLSLAPPSESKHGGP